MESHAEAYLKRLLEAVIPSYRAVPGLTAIKVLRRPLVAYEEISILTTWKSEEHMRKFSEPNPVSSPDSALIQREPPHIYQLVLDAFHTQEADS